MFTGDNTKVTATLSQAAAKRNDAIQRGARNILDNLSSAASKRVSKVKSELAAGEPEKLNDKLVDLTVVKDIRRVLRRKYASRSNIDKIFNQWDQENKGNISAQDLLNGLNKIGIRINLEEALVLQNSAKQDKACQQNLSKDEFHSLLFSRSDDFAVDLNKIEAPTDDIKAATT